MSWQRIRGHDQIIQSFDHVVRRGRLAHAYLFTGPPGVGKRLFAGELAKALLCEGGKGRGGEEETRRQGDKETGRPRLEACDHCPACLLVEAGTHPDLQTARRPDDKSEVSIDIVRELARGLDLKPARGRGKMVILDDADDLNEESANCFLKTLEEPPPGALLILIGTSADRQLPTIVSRCQFVHFHPLPEALVAELLASQHIKDAAFVRRVARLCGGSPGQALALADPELWQFRRKLIQGLTQPRPDSVGLAQDWTKFYEEVGKESAAQRRRVSLVLRLLIDFLNDALSVSVGKSPRLADETDLPLLQKFAQQTDTDQIMQMIDRCLEADLQNDRNVQLVLIIEALIDSLSSVSGSVA
jgi:DNA polymerase-3 subunit delta'